MRRSRPRAVTRKSGTLAWTAKKDNVIVRGVKVLARYRVIAVVGLACLLASACASSHSTANGQGGLTHVVVGQLPIADTATVRIPMKEGLFRQQGLDVTTVPIQQVTEAIPMMLHRGRRHHVRQLHDLH